MQNKIGRCNMKGKLIAVCLTGSLLAGCTYGVEMGPIELPPSQDGNLQPLASSLSPVENIYIQYQDGFDVKTAVASFEPKGIIKGTQSPMIPLDEEQSDLAALGFITHISLDGQEAYLQYNDSVIKFKVRDTMMYVDDKPGIALSDKPLYNNATIYIPIVPVLDALKIDYSISSTDLTIGARYTDSSGNPNPDATGEVQTDQPDTEQQEETGVQLDQTPVEEIEGE